MTSRVRSACGRFLIRCAAVVALLACATTLAAQQVTGKVEGTVSDQAGVPLANAQVLVMGTSFGAVTNDQGYYFINNVPVGTYTLRAQFIGYAPSEVRGVRVVGGQTITVDVRMQTSAVEVTGITVTAAANPIVPRDQVTSKNILSGELVDRLPVSDVRELLTFSPGVVESGSGAGVSIRGGRPGEANVYIDGAPVRGTNSGSQRITIGTNALEEASVTTGALGVEFADAQSGVIAYTTRAGGRNLSGSLSYESDEPFGDAISVGYNRFEGALGGPIPGVQNLTWFVSGVLEGQVSAFRGKGTEDVARYVTGGVDQVVVRESDGTSVTLPRFVQFSGQCDAADNFGFECQGRRFPMDWATGIRLQGKLQYSYGSGSSVSFTGLANGNQSRNTPGTTISAPSVFSGTHTWQRLAVLNWNHQLFRTAERALSINANLSYGRDRAVSGPLDPATELDSRSPALGLYFGTLEFEGYDQFASFFEDSPEQLIRNIRTNEGLRVPLLDRNDLRNSQGGLRTNPYGMQSGGWIVSGFDVAGSLLDEKRYNGRLVVDWQANRFHRFTLGGDAKRVELKFWSSGFLRQAFMDAYYVKPEQYGLFAADRLDLGDVVLELGVRWDYYNSNALFQTLPSRTFTTPTFVTNYADAATNDATYAAYLADRDIWTPSEGHSTIAPRLRVSFPVTEETGFRLSYAHQVQTPEFTTLLTGVNNDISFTNTNDIWGRDLEFGKTILFEFGVRHAFSPDLVLDLSAYNKDKASDYAARTLPFQSPRDPTDTTFVNVLTNLDFGNSKGLDLKLDWRVGTLLSTSVAYTYQIAKGTGSDPFTYLNTFARQVSGLTGDRTPPPEQAQRTNNDRTHNLGGSIALQLPDDFRRGTAWNPVFRNVSAFATFSARSGLPYTRLVNAGDGQSAPFVAFGLGGRAGEPLNASVLPWTSNIDLRVNKGFRFGRLDVTAYADFRNLLNLDNTVGVFAETGDVVNAKHRNDTFINPELQGLANEAALAGALAADGTINLIQNCQTWNTPVNCEALRRVEARFGDGNGLYSLAEQNTALNAAYDSFNGPWRFKGAPRHIRLGFELNF
jgi:hypothetical protein